MIQDFPGGSKNVQKQPMLNVVYVKRLLIYLSWESLLSFHMHQEKHQKAQKSNNKNIYAASAEIFKFRE